MACELLTRRHANTLILTLSAPAAPDCLSPQLLSAAIEALNVAEPDDTVSCVVLTGAEGQFCVGPSTQGATAAFDADRFDALLEALRAYPQPVIAAVEGEAAAQGVALALACDMVCASQAARFRAEAQALSSMLETLAARVARAQLIEALWTSQNDALTGQILHDWGVINELTPPGGALSAALHWADRLSERSHRALADIKERVNASSRLRLSAR